MHSNEGARPSLLIKMMATARHRRLVLSLALVIATTASALQHTCSKSIALRGGSDDEGLFGGEAVDDDDEETKASKRYAAAVAQLRKEGGECAALDAFEAESLKSDRDESKLAVLWMDV